MKRSLVVIALWTARAEARDAHVTATTRATVYIDAGEADGLTAGAAWHASIGGRQVAVRVAALASHDAVLELDGALPAIGAAIALPPGLTPPSAVVPLPRPIAMPAWQDDPVALGDVRRAASHEQPRAIAADDGTRVSGELSLSLFGAADTSGTSTSWQELALGSQLSVESGSWRYDHLLEARLAGSPELFTSPLQHAQGQFDVYLLRLAYAPAGAAYAAAIGRMPAAPLTELGTVDGGQARVVVGPHVDVTGFAGLRPASDLGLSLAPRAGADLGWHTTTLDGLRAQVDLGAAVDEYKGSLDRAESAASVTISRRALLAHGDAVVDLASDATGRSGPRVSHASALLRGKWGRLTASLQGGYDRPIVDRALAAEEPELLLLPLLGPRSFTAVDLTYALASGFDLGGSGRVSFGDGVTSGYADVLGRWYAPTRSWYATLAPHVIFGSLVDQYGLRGSIDVPRAGWSLGVGGSLDRVATGGDTAWAGLGRISASRPFLARWRTSLSLEVAAGDGPVRALVFAMLAYRFGK